MTMQRLRGICGIKNSRTGREAVGQAHGWRDQREDFGNLKAAVFAGINGMREYIQFSRRSTISALHSSDNVDKFWDTGLQP